MMQRTLPSRVTGWIAGGLALAVVLGVGLASLASPRAAAQATLAPLPAGWPSTALEIGAASAPGEAAALKADAPFRFRYQYLAGGVNTGNGWATWNTNGDFVTYYVQDSAANGIVPLFVYYQIFQSNGPCNACDEAQKDLANLNDTATMTALYEDLRLFFQRAAGSSPVLLNMEPDLWGYIQQAARGDDAATVPARVSATGLPELAGLPDNAAGFAQAVAVLRDTYAPNVQIGYHLSIWGTGTDIQYSKPSDAEVDALATRSAGFFGSLNAPYELHFGEFDDRDSAFNQVQYGDGGASWMSPADFARHARYLGTFSQATQKRLVLWQIPLGNTRMRAMDNTWGHYQDNRVETLLDDATRANLETYRQAGVIALLFGAGAGGNTHASDQNGDGVTNPAPINGNDRLSLSADDDGGFFKDRVRAYYTTGPLPLGAATAPATATTLPATATATAPAVPATPTATSGPPPPAAGFTTSAKVAPLAVAPGTTTTLAASVNSETAGTYLVDLEVYGPDGAKVHQQFWDGHAFSAGQARTFSSAWSVPVGAAAGTYRVVVGVFSPGWGALLHWNDAAGQVAVGSAPVATATATQPPATQPPATPTPTLTSHTAPQPGFTTSAQASPTTVSRGAKETITASVTSATATKVLVDVEVYDSTGAKVFQKVYNNQLFAAGQQRSYSTAWVVPSTAPPGAYTVKIGVFSPGWGTLHNWNDAAAGFAVR